uniref:Stigma-specific Stig1 family protein n=1 Tax=Kalanchoe fedtschenkoi TaxID=63787 RepID=A0A7N0RFA5_KALFE
MSLLVGEADDQEGYDGYLVEQEIDDDEVRDKEEEEEVGLGLIRGTGRMLAGHQKKMTCDKYPRVCRVAGSPGRDCCKKKCVNVDSDRANCGRCGKKCKFSEACCKGKCVNVLRDNKNCGRCVGTSARREIHVDMGCAATLRNSTFILANLVLLAMRLILCN